MAIAIARMAEYDDASDAKKTPAANRISPRIVACALLTNPLGMGRSGRSTASSSASKTSFMTTPPPYNPIVDKMSHTTEEWCSVD